MVAVINAATNPKNFPVFMHCEAGGGRTNLFRAGYLIVAYGLSAHQALALASPATPQQKDWIRSFAERAHQLPGLDLRWKPTGRERQQVLAQLPAGLQ
jgi:hypothetical protein